MAWWISASGHWIRTGSAFIGNNNKGTIFVTPNFIANDQLFTQFISNALPAYVEVELGVLEDRALAHYQALAITGTLGRGTPLGDT